jgi:hypothetical protein
VWKEDFQELSGRVHKRSPAEARERKPKGQHDCRLETRARLTIVIGDE